MHRRDTLTNLFVAVASILFWFNPLMHLARHAMRLDQELACDALALEDVNVGPRAYGEVLLKAQLAGPRSWLACAWSGMARSSRWSFACGCSASVAIRCHAKCSGPPLSLRSRSPCR